MMFHADASAAYISVKMKRFCTHGCVKPNGIAERIPKATAARTTPPMRSRVRSHPARARRTTPADATRASRSARRRTPAREQQRVEVCAGLNRDTGGGGSAFGPVSNGVFIHVYEPDGNFDWHWKAGDFP